MSKQTEHSFVAGVYYCHTTHTYVWQTIPEAYACVWEILTKGPHAYQGHGGPHETYGGISTTQFGEHLVVVEEDVHGAHEEETEENVETVQETELQVVEESAEESAETVQEERQETLEAYLARQAAGQKVAQTAPQEASEEALTVNIPSAERLEALEHEIAGKEASDYLRHLETGEALTTDVVPVERLEADDLERVAARAEEILVQAPGETLEAFIERAHEAARASLAPSAGEGSADFTTW